MATVSNPHLKLTYEDYVLLPDDGKTHEIIDGDHYMSPAPGTYHQTVSRRILFQLYEQIEKKSLGQVFNAPTDLELSDVDIVQPDLLIIHEERRSMISPAMVIGPPDLVVEILSESTQKKDQTLKLDLYQKTGVPEYWIVDPERQHVVKYRLRDEGYEQIGEFHDRIAYDGIEGISVDLLEVW